MRAGVALQAMRAGVALQLGSEVGSACSSPHGLQTQRAENDTVYPIRAD